MNVFDVIKLFGGLAMFLYGMRLMGDGLKEGSSGTLKKALEKVTNSSVKAFFLGLAMTAVIQSSTATIVITSGLVGAGILSLHQSLGIIIGANVGTTVTGQIIRLLDVDASGASLLRFFQPSTLAPLALIAGIVIIMSSQKKTLRNAGNIVIGFGILFSGLLNMTAAVSVLSDTGLFDSLFSNLSDSPLLGYIVGAGVAFVLQSSSATIGILQAFSMTGELTFGAVYSVIVGIYLGDCVTTAIVCSIGARPEAKRVGVVNILFNLSETVLVLTVVGIIHRLGGLTELWAAPIHSGGIANTNTVFNLGCAIALFPLLPVYERISRRIIKDTEAEAGSSYADLTEALNPAFFNTPALAFRSCYNALGKMLELACENFRRSISLFRTYDEALYERIAADEGVIDVLADEVSRYLVQMSPNVTTENYVGIFEEYNKVLTEFERLGDHAMSIAERAKSMTESKERFSEHALRELDVIMELQEQILGFTKTAFWRRSLSDAKQIEPLEEVACDVIDRMRDNHLFRLRNGLCSIGAGVSLLDVLTNLEHISENCSKVGLAVVVRAEDRSIQPHDYRTFLHEGNDAWYNAEYSRAHEHYFKLLDALDTPEA